MLKLEFVDGAKSIIHSDMDIGECSSLKNIISVVNDFLVGIGYNQKMVRQYLDDEGLNLE